MVRLKWLFYALKAFDCYSCHPSVSKKEHVSRCNFIYALKCTTSCTIAREKSLSNIFPSLDTTVLYCAVKYFEGGGGGGGGYLVV